MMPHPALPLLRDALAPFVADFALPDFEDLMIQRPGEAWLRIGGRIERREAPEMDADSIEAIARLAGALKGQNIGGAHKPIMGCDMPGGVRVHAVLPP